MKHATLGIITALLGCAHGRLQSVPLLVSPDVLVDDPAAFPRLQALRGALLDALREGGYCLDRAGDFEGILALSADTEGDAVTVHLTLDTAAGSRVDEVEATLPATAAPDLRPLLRDLAASGETGDFAAGAAQDRCRAAPAIGKSSAGSPDFLRIAPATNGRSHGNH